MADKKYLTLTWCADLQLENNLRRMAVVFDVATIAFSSLDLKESQVNGARVNDALIPARVEDYKQGFVNGDTFPRIVVHKTPTGHVILGGNQRSEALRQLIVEGLLPKTIAIEAYLVETKDRLLLEIIARSANVAHGASSGKEERIAHAVHCVQSLGMSVDQAALIFVVAPSTIRSHITADEQRKTLAAAGIDAYKLPNRTIEPLGQIEYDAGAQVKLGSLIVLHEPPAERVRQVVMKVKKQKTPADRSRVIKEWERELATEAHSNGHAKNGQAEVEKSRIPIRPRRDKAFRLLSSLVNFLESENGGEAFTDLEQLQCSSVSDRERITKLCNKLSYRLRVLAK